MVFHKIPNFLKNKIKLSIVRPISLMPALPVGSPPKNVHKPNNKEVRPYEYKTTQVSLCIDKTGGTDDGFCPINYTQHLISNY